MNDEIGEAKKRWYVIIETENTPVIDLHYVKHLFVPKGWYSCSDHHPSRSFNLAGPKCTENNNCKN